MGRRIVLWKSVGILYLHFEDREERESSHNMEVREAAYQHHHHH